MQAITGPLYAALGATGAPALVRSLNRAGVVLCYHNVVAAHPGGTGAPGAHLPRDAFCRQMQWVAARYTVVPLLELVQRLVHGKSLRRLAAVTFDDGYRGVLAHALPVVRDLGLPVTIFVVSGAAERGRPFWWDHPLPARADTPARRARWLHELRGDGDAILADARAGEPNALPDDCRPATWAALAAAASAGVTLGVHSATHRTLPRLTDAELEGELAASRAAVHQAAGAAPEVFAYPYGCWDSRTRAAVRACGYRAAVTLDHGLVHAGADPWALPRVNVPATITRAAFAAWCAGLNLRRLLPR
jgi:peptidoglycan/xylan/chitin deacetylase (PgdA/CDA1 family)